MEIITIKNKLINTNKVISLDYAYSDKVQKHYLIILLDVISTDNKIYIEVKDQSDYNLIIIDVKNQLNK
jgi:hypothetical protein